METHNNIPPADIIAIISAITTAINSIIAAITRAIEKKKMRKQFAEEKETAVKNAVERERGNLDTYGTRNK